MSVRNATQFVKLVENRLGWVPPSTVGYRKYHPEVGKVNRKVATNPHLYTWPNLELAVELLARRHEARSPIGVFAYVEQALSVAVETESEIETEIRKVIGYELSLGDPAGWAVRLTRAVGPYRRQALNEWRESARG